MNRKQFIQGEGATCKNWTWSWSFVNHTDKFVIFGAWDVHTENGVTLILSKDWSHTSSGRKSASYPQAVEHVQLVERRGYALKVYPIKYSDEKRDSAGIGPAAIDGFNPVLLDRALKKVGDDWFAIREPQHQDIIEWGACIKKNSRKSRVQVNKQEILEEMYKYYKDNKSWLPSDISKHRADIIASMIEGKNAVDAYSEFI